MHARWDAVLFDLDGTLVDSIGLILACYRHTMRTHFGQEFDDERWLEGLGTPLDRQLAAFARDEVEARAMRETYIVYQRTVHDGMVRAFAGIPELLRDLVRAGCPLGIVTSKRREMTDRSLRVCGIDAFFGAIVTPERVRNGKPDPEPVLAALRDLGARPEHVLFVGDAPADLAAGRAAGVATGAALWGPFPRERLIAHGPDHWLETVADMRALTLEE